MAKPDYTAKGRATRAKYARQAAARGWTWVRTNEAMLERFGVGLATATYAQFKVEVAATAKAKKAKKATKKPYEKLVEQKILDDVEASSDQDLRQSLEAVRTLMRRDGIEAIEITSDGARVRRVETIDV